MVSCSLLFSSGSLKDVLRHRIGLTYEAEAENVNVEQIINEILRVVNVP